MCKFEHLWNVVREVREILENIYKKCHENEGEQHHQIYAKVPQSMWDRPWVVDQARWLKLFRLTKSLA